MLIGASAVFARKTPQREKKFAAQENKKSEGARRDASSPGKRGVPLQFPEELLQERKYTLRSGIGLRQRSHAGLQQDLRFG
jgi:hypothetical protein